jgi:hypothetical protein
MGPAHAVGPLGWRAEQVVIYITHQTGQDCELYKERKCVAEVKNYKDMEEVYMDI